MNTNIRVCKHCKKIFVARTLKQEFCNNECKYNYYNVYYNCDKCGDEFITKRTMIQRLERGDRKHLYCPKCTNNGEGTTNVTNICAICKKEFSVSKSFLEQKYCSKECSAIGRIKYNDIECPICKKIFHPKSKSTIFCSNECKFESTKDRIKCNCYYCGKEFERKKSEVEKNKKHYCSFDCKLADIKWNQSDLDILRKYYNKIDNKEIQKMLSKDWSIKAIRAKSQILGLGKNRKWNNEEETLLKEIFSTQSIGNVLKQFPKRTLHSILGKAHTLGLTSKFYNDRKYTNEDLCFLKENYLNMTDDELSQQISGNHSAYGVHQRLCLMGLYRPYEIKKDGYINLNRFVRERLTMWKKEVREYYNYTCCLSGSRSNIIVHHCRGFNLLFDETIDILNFPMKENFTDYTDEELLLFVNKFLEIQDYYNAYVCITEEIHKLFHKEYGYGDNTEEQWEEFVINYKNGKYELVA